MQFNVAHDYMIRFIFCFCYFATAYFSIRLTFWLMKQMSLIISYIYCFIISYNAECDADGNRYNFFRYVAMYLSDERCPYFERWRKHDNRSNR